MDKIVYLLVSLSLAVCQGQERRENKQLNILFIAIDDLRPELGSYGSDLAISPNLDQLASEGLQFNRAYCQQAICGPSRASVLTGMRPETSGIIHNYIKIRDTFPNVITLPQHFKNNGYRTIYAGKIFHHGDKDDEQSWSQVLEVHTDSLKKGLGTKGFVLPENKAKQQAKRKEMFTKYGEVAKYGLAMGPAFEAADVPDNHYIDGYNTDLAINALSRLSQKKDERFFLALGFNKPHLNWNAPQKYWDMYDPKLLERYQPNMVPENGAAMGLHPSFELRVRDGIPKSGEIHRDLQTSLLHGYLACISYVDAQIGRMISALDQSGLRDSTVIVIWSDHGYHLGDMGIWGKATNYEIATRVPLLIWTPEIPDTTKGQQTNALVELVDIYPTLTDLAGLEQPAHLDGHSFAPLILNPETPWKTAAFSQFPTPALREWGAIALRQGMRETYFGPLLQTVEEKIKAQQAKHWNRTLFEEHLMGYAMRTERYRLVAWKHRGDKTSTPLFVELYDHISDPKESKNIALEHPEITTDLLTQLNEGPLGNLPKTQSK